MYRIPYYAYGDHDSMLIIHTIQQPQSDSYRDVTTRWYEVRVTEEDVTPTLYQQGNYNPDDTSRWMGSIAMNSNGAIVLGYSVSSTSVYPGIRFAYRFPDNRLGKMNPEQTIIDGTGYQVSTYNRWGDYSCMSLDPTDENMFWYTQQYIETSGSFNWQTRIAFINVSSLPSVISNDDDVDDHYFDDDANNNNSNGKKDLSTQNVILISVFSILGVVCCFSGIGYFIYKKKSSETLL